jgi:uncharacterized membrane protein YciS (DUF1049 family)
MKILAPLLAAIIVLALWFSALWIGYAFFPSWQERGQFGDLFGSVNALFSGLAFAGLIYAILLQRQELSLQRAELKLQREEMAASRAELAAQVAVQKQALRVYIGQIRVSAQQARIEAMKMDSESRTPGARGDWVKSINKVAEQIDQIASELENG